MGVPRDGEPGRFVTRVHPVEATTNAISALADFQAGLRIQKAVLSRPVTTGGSSSTYSRPLDWTWI
jgi:hypothetical protein